MFVILMDLFMIFKNLNVMIVNGLSTVFNFCCVLVEPILETI